MVPVSIFVRRYGSFCLYFYSFYIVIGFINTFSFFLLHITESDVIVHVIYNCSVMCCNHLEDIKMHHKLYKITDLWIYTI